jgi:hypothetical protein
MGDATKQLSDRRGHPKSLTRSRKRRAPSRDQMTRYLRLAYQPRSRSRPCRRLGRRIIAGRGPQYSTDKVRACDCATEVSVNQREVCAVPWDRAQRCERLRRLGTFGLPSDEPSLLRKRTPAPPPFSGINSTPAASRAR